MYIYYNITMNDKVKQMAREILQPFFDELIETSCRIFSSVYDNLPAEMPVEEKDAIVQGIIKQQRETLISSVKAGVPTDFENKLKEAFNGGK